MTPVAGITGRGEALPRPPLVIKILQGLRKPLRTRINHSIMSKRRDQTSEIGPGWETMLSIRLAPSRQASAAGGRGSAIAPTT